MYLRLVQMKFQPDLVGEIKYHYEKEIIPALEKTEGCLYAGVAQNNQRKDEGISLTLWNHESAANAYERSGEFAKLLAVLRPYFSDLSEWSLALSEDLRLEYAPVASEPEVRSYVSALEVAAAMPPGARHENLYLRVVSMKVQDGKIDQFRSLYKEHVFPVVRNYPGCMLVQLAQSVAHATEFLSVTVWNTKEAAQNYEESGTFAKLKNSLKPALLGFSLWSMDTDGGAHLAATSDHTLDVQTYTIVTGRAFA
jgi:quinol monooxygenase YgiN